MALKRNAPILLMGLVGVGTGYYIFNDPLKSAAADARRSTPGQSQPGAQTSNSTPQANPHPSLHTGGASPVDQGAPTVAGTSEAARKSGSADKDVKLRSKEDAKQQDGTGGGGVGVAEMRERKMKGQGLPSPQGGDTKAQPVKAQPGYAAPQDGPAHR